MKRMWLAVIMLVLPLCAAVAASLSVSVNNSSDGSPYYQVEFGTVSSPASYAAANQYLSLAFSPFTGVPLWKLDIYTDNKTSTAPGDKGGLMLSGDTALRLPLAWNAALSAGSPPPAAPGSGGPLWQWMKDKNDSDWTASRDSGYTAVVTDSGDGPKIYGGLACGTTVFVSLEAKFEGAAAGQYSGTIWFDMYPVMDLNPPVFTHIPLTTIVGRNCLLVLKGDVKDDVKITYVRIHYKTDLSGWKTLDLPLAGPARFKTFVFRKKLSELGKISAFYYALEASDGYNVTWFGTESGPHKITILDRILFSDVLSGQYDIPDGNQDGGCTRVMIPEGALSGRIGLTVRPADDGEAPGRQAPDGSGAERPPAAFTFGPDGTHFLKPVTLTLHYYDYDDDGNVEFQDGSPTGHREEELRVFWWDGFGWRLVGGTLDPANNTLTFQANHFSVYALFAQGAMTAADYRPKEKIITPAGSSGDTSARFDGLNGSDYKIKIFDVTGVPVRTISPPALPEWDGKDEGGRIVESGVYVYQFEADVAGSKKVISGTIVVAK